MFKCKCNREFKTQRSLVSHARFCQDYVKKNKKSKYLIGDQYICECKKSFDKPQSLNSHFSHCLIHRKGVPVNRVDSRSGWNKGLTKDTHPSILNMAKAISINTKGKPGNPHTIESKKNLSIKRIKFLENNPNSNIAWYSVNNGIRDIKVQGKWEYDVACWLNDNNIKWDRIRIPFDGHRTYTPDFWLVEYDFYLEVKGWMREHDLIKMKKVRDQTNITIKILDKELYESLNSFSLNKLKSLENF